jgi:PAS domain S-box-containing protein
MFGQHRAMDAIHADRAQDANPLQGPLARLAESGVVGVLLWDADGRIHEANDRFLEIVGYSRDDLAAGLLAWPTLVPPDRHEKERASRERLKAAGIARGEEMEYLRRDGARIVVKLHSAVCPDPRWIVSIAVDVSEQKRSEAERVSLMQREMQARAEAEAAVHSRDDLLAIVSHDLRNPLNVIAMSASVLESPLADAARMAQLGIIRRAVARMDRLIADLLDVAQITAGTLRLVTEPLDAAAICEDARQSFVPLLAAKHQQFACTVPAKPIKVVADRDRISQVLSNLVGNAHKFTPEGGRIEARVEAVQGFAQFTVSDTGPGLSERDLPHVFDRFWQARRVRRGGVGLGLPIAKGIVDAHGGRIWAESVPGVGTTFHFTIPVA